MRVARPHERAVGEGRSIAEQEGVLGEVPLERGQQLVAFFHSLVGLAAVFVAAGALYAPKAFHILGVNGIKTASLIEMSLGVAIGAITFSGITPGFFFSKAGKKEIAVNAQIA